MTLQTAFFPLADLLLKGVVVLIVTTALAALLRRASAANRSALWSTAALVLLLLPITLLLQPRWSWVATGAPSTAPTEALVHAAMQGPEFLVSAMSPLEAVNAWNLPDPQSAVVLVWLSGALLVLARRAIGSLQLLRLKRRSISPPDRILHVAREIAECSQLRRTPRVILTETKTVPLTWGTWRPVVMLPIEAGEWPDELLRIVLRHEYSHIIRHDSAFRLVSQIACAIHWLNPLVWAAGRKLRLHQEQASDDLVLAAGVDPLEYADELVASVRRFLQPTGAFRHALTMAQPTTLEARVGAVLDEGRDRRPVKGHSIAWSSATLLLVLTASALAQVAAKDAPTPLPAAGARAGSSSLEMKPERRLVIPDAPQEAGAPIVTRQADEVSAAALAEFSAIPLEIDAENTSFRNGIAVASGAAKLTYRDVTITADWLEYDPSTKAVTAHGRVVFTVENGNKVTGPDIVLEHNLLTKKTKVTGNHEVAIKGQTDVAK